MPKAIVRVPLTYFLRFLSATGLTRANAVDEALQEYSQGKDYYLDLRKEMVLALKNNDPGRLERFIENRPPDRKSEHYATCARGLIRWMAATDYEFLVAPRPRVWRAGPLSISINPEMTIAVDGVKYLVKLYLAKQMPGVPARRAFSWLVRETHGNLMTPALLDVRKHRLMPTPDPGSRTGRMVRGEAGGFLAYVNLDKAA